MSTENSGDVTSLESSEIVKKFARKAGDTGSPEVQVAILTKRIEEVAKHSKVHVKDFHTQRGLMKLVSKRKRLLSYLKTESNERYKNVIAALGLRK